MSDICMLKFMFGAFGTSCDCTSGAFFEANAEADIRFYLQNIDGAYKLVAVRAQPDGSLDVDEIAKPMKWTLAKTSNF